MQTLSKKENFLRAIRGGICEKVPWVPFVGVHSAKLLGVPLKDFLYSSELISQGVVKAANLYNADAIPVSFDLHLEAELLGAKTISLPKLPPAIIKHPLAEGEISELPEYDTNSGRLKIVLDAVEKIKSQLPDTALFALVTGVLTLAYQLRGRRLLDDIASNDAGLCPLLNYCKCIQSKTISAYLERGVDAIALVEPLCSGLSPSFFASHLSPLSDELFEQINSAGVPSSFFLCGDVSAILGEISKTKCNNICTCSNVDLHLLKEKALLANKSFGGNLNPRDSILNASVEKSLKDARKCLEIGGNKGYILSSGCDLAFDSPIENLVAISKL